MDAIPGIGYVLFLLLGLAIAVVTFACARGNVPVAAVLKAVGVPPGAGKALGACAIAPWVADLRARAHMTGTSLPATRNRQLPGRSRDRGIDGHGSEPSTRYPAPSEPVGKHPRSTAT